MGVCTVLPLFVLAKFHTNNQPINKEAFKVDQIFVDVCVVAVVADAAAAAGAGTDADVAAAAADLVDV